MITALVDLLVIQQESSSKCAMALFSHARVLTEIRQTVAFGMYSAFCRIKWAPHVMHNFISLIPMVVMEDPPTPLTVCAEISQRVMKSDFSGEIWMVAPVST